MLLPFALMRELNGSGLEGFGAKWPTSLACTAVALTSLKYLTIYRGKMFYYKPDYYTTLW